VKKGDLVRFVEGVNMYGDIVATLRNRWVGVVLEVRTSPSMTIGRGHFREERTEIRAFFAENPQMSKHFSNAKFFEVISEAK
jgi:hypothetical protein